MSLKDIISPFYAWGRAFDKPYTIIKPVDEREGADGYRGFHINDINACIGCGTCEEICQNEAIDMVPVEGIEPGKGDSGLRPLVDYGRCCWCGLCVDACPTGSLGMSNEYKWVSTDADEFRFIPGIDEKPWNHAEKGYRRSEEAWLLTPEKHEMPVLKPDVRKSTFEEMALGYTDKLSVDEASRCLECGLCVDACPAHMDIPEYIRAIREGRLDDGLKTLYDSNPFSESCGRICTAHCQDVCALSHNGDAIPIRSLKRYITDKTVNQKNEILGIDKKLPDSGKKIAIIGGGPSGLTAAYYLRNYGHAVTIYEKHKELGGMLRYGIPEYRLPKAVLDREIRVILDTGVKLIKNIAIGTDVELAELQNKYDAVYLSVGAQKGTGMNIEGMYTEGILIGVDFLDQIASGERPDLGDNVVVVGGGNTAMDVCRSAVRLGSTNVQVLYRRTEQEMPANQEEIIEAKEEGVEFHYLAAPVGITKKNGKLEIRVIRMKLGEPDASGRRRPVPIENSEYIVEADTCIMAIGQKVDEKVTRGAEIGFTRWGTFDVNRETLATNIDGIFAGGDCQTGPDDAIRAIADGKKVAYSINRFLNKTKF